MFIKKNYLVEKRNVLNELRSNEMSLQELRFLSIYLAKINARDVSTRVVRFTLPEFQKIMEMGKLNIKQLRGTVDGLLTKIVEVPLDNPDDKVPVEKQSFVRFQLFKRAVFGLDANGERYIEIDAHDDALPLLFDFQKDYFTYELWNAIWLKSVNQFRMYEILKQYEHRGERIISIKDLRRFLGIREGDYQRFNNFKTRVLDACQQALATNTDIKFSYEPAVKKGKGGKVEYLRFIIAKNRNYKDGLSLSNFLDQETLNRHTVIDTEEYKEKGPDYFEDEVYPFLSDACENEFSRAEIQVLYNLVLKAIPIRPKQDFLLDAYHYLKRKHDELKWRAEKTEIKNRMGYLKKIIEAGIAERHE